MDRLENDRQTRTALLDSYASSEPPPAPATTSRPSASDADLERAYAHIPQAPGFLEGVARLAARASQETEHAEVTPKVVAEANRKAVDTQIQFRLDEFRDRFAGPYRVTVTDKSGSTPATISATPMFRMNTSYSYNQEKVKAHYSELCSICRKAGIESYAALAVSGRCTPEQLVKVTQALVDAGKLGEVSADEAAGKIHALQWEWGIGVDCAGYTQQAAAYAHGASGEAFKPGLMGDIFSRMGHDPRFANVDVTKIRPGDVIHLDNPTQGQVGHNVIVQSHTALGDAMRADLAKRGGDAPAFVAGRGPFHVLTVDSSWGAGKEGNPCGGYRRDTWLYDEDNHQWGYFEPTTHVFLKSENGPQDEIFAGAYRPKGAP